MPVMKNIPRRFFRSRIISHVGVGIALPRSLNPSPNPKIEENEHGAKNWILTFNRTMMANLEKKEETLLALPHFGAEGGEGVNSHALSLEKKIDFLESLASKVSNRRSRRWLNDRLLIELVPRLNAEEIRGLFAPPPWGDNVPLSPFCMTNVREWDAYRSIDMDREATMIEALSSTRRKDRVHTDRMAAVNAWKRIDCRTREALRRNFLPDLVEGFEVCCNKWYKSDVNYPRYGVGKDSSGLHCQSILVSLRLLSDVEFKSYQCVCTLSASGWFQLDCLRTFIMESGDGDVLVLHVQDAFHRLLLHGVCEFYDLVSVTVTGPKESKPVKTTRIKKKKGGCREVPNMTLTHFLKSAKQGTVKSS